MPTITLNTSWKIHDNWTELLDGTHYFLTLLLNETNNKIPKNILARSILINSHQLVELMFFNVIKKHINTNKLILDSHVLHKISSGMDDNTGIKVAMTEWPILLTGNSFDRSCEPFTSQEKLRVIRNRLIHWPSDISVINLVNSAFYTAIRSSEVIYSHFFDWTESEYSKFVQSINISKTEIHLVKRLQKENINL